MNNKSFPLFIVIGLVAIVTIFSTVIVINAGEVGVVTRFGKLMQNRLNPGLNFVIPYVDRVTHMNLRIVKHEVDSEGATKDLQSVSVRVAVAYQLQNENVTKLYETIGDDDRINETILFPAIQEAVKATSAEFTAEELITKRNEFKTEVDKALKERVAGYYFNIEEVSIVNFSFSDAFNQAVESKQVAEQRAKQAGYEVEQMKKEVEKYKLQSESLTDNILRKMYIEKWDGKLPQYVGDKDALSILINGKVQ